MKIRNGFVSNSSSSSFVVIGVKKFVDDDQLTGGLSCLYVEEGKFDYVTGYVIADGDDYLDFNDISVEDFMNKAKKIAETLNVDVNEVHLITGTRPS